MNMKVFSKIVFGLLLSVGGLAVIAPVRAQAKNVKTAKNTATNAPKFVNQDIFETLSKKEAGQGSVAISQHPNMKVLLEKKNNDTDAQGNVVISGFRVQIYMGNKQKLSKSEAFEREKLVKEKYKELSSYVTFASPFWRLRVGDFRNYADALVLASSLKTDFPDFASEIYVIKDDEVRDVELEKELKKAKK